MTGVPSRVALGDVELLEPEHRYVLRESGLELPGVTHTMRAHGLGFQGFAPDEALRRGRMVHEASVLIDQDDLELEAFPEKWRGYLAAYEAAIAETRTKMLHAEWRFWHPRYLYAGTLDRIAIRGGRRGIIEIKTGDATDVDVQTAAYERGWLAWNPELVLEWSECWKLNENGTCDRWSLDLNHGWRVFAALLVIEERRRQHGSRTGNGTLAA